MRHPTEPSVLSQIGIKFSKHDPPGADSIVITITVDSTAYVDNDQI